LRCFAPVAWLTLSVLAGIVATPAAALTLRIGSQGDALSMDPHSLAEALQFSVMGNVYETLVERDADFRISPALATSWKQTTPTTWHFELRSGVLFHDRTPFTADDVIFSWQRARGEGSDVSFYVQPIRDIVRVNDHAVDIVTHAPFSILPEQLTNFYIMSKSWCTANQATRPVDRRRGIENTASFKANGTGPFVLRERVPGVRTVFRRNPVYWAPVRGNVDEVVFSVVGNDATRTAALMSGELDVIDPVPVQDLDRIKAQPNLQVVEGPENRVIFLGMDQKRNELLFSNVKGANPFKDRRVRQAFYQAIDIDGIRKNIMRGSAVPMGLMIAPQVNGYAPELAARLPYDPEASRKLLSDAGYPNGFEVKLNCPNDRYINDSRVCQAVGANLARVGIKVQLELESKGLWFPKVLRRDVSFFMLGWTPATVDAHNTLFPVIGTPGEGGRGNSNGGSYSNARVDELIDLIASESDARTRNEQIREAMKIHQDDIGHIPLYQPFLYWGTRRDVKLVQLPNSRMYWKYIEVSTSPGPVDKLAGKPSRPSLSH
jgi:peptide/nickel transport system substrate-binding protein